MGGCGGQGELPEVRVASTLLRLILICINERIAMTEQTARPALPLPAPHDPLERLLLIAMRRMGAHGLHDAWAALLLLDRFGLHFRRPLVLLRAYVMELARTSQRQIVLAPCCAGRMTEDEGRMVAALALALANPAESRRQLGRLCASATVDQPLSVCLALAETLADLGRPLVR